MDERAERFKKKRLAAKQKRQEQETEDKPFVSLLEIWIKQRCQTKRKERTARARQHVKLLHGTTRRRSRRSPDQ